MSNFSEKFAKHSVVSLEELKEQTEIGQYIGFHVAVMNIFGHWHVEKVSGFVTEKYPYIFRLDNGQTYQWVDYMLGKIF